MARALCLNWVQRYADYPLRQLYDENIKLILGTGMPSLYKTTLTDEYLAAIEHGGFSLDELVETALNALDFSLMSAEEKETMRQEFVQAYAQLREEHIISEETS